MREYHGTLRQRLRNTKAFDWLETKYYNITIGIRNIFQWLPVVWKDREWEYNYFTMQFIYKKLKLHQKRPYDEVIVDGWWFTKYINLCIRLIDEERKMDDLEDDLWKSCEHCEMRTDETPDKDGNYEVHFNWSSPEAEQKYHDIQKLRYIREKKIHKLIYKILADRGGYWWD